MGDADQNYGLNHRLALIICHQAALIWGEKKHPNVRLHPCFFFCYAAHLILLSCLRWLTGYEISSFVQQSGEHTLTVVLSDIVM